MYSGNETEKKEKQNLPCNSEHFGKKKYDKPNDTF